MPAVSIPVSEVEATKEFWQYSLNHRALNVLVTLCEHWNEYYKNGRCNSSHGGSCCNCGKELRVIHFHLFEIATNYGGVSCSLKCAQKHQEWFLKNPVVTYDDGFKHRLYSCPGHGGRTPIKQFFRRLFRNESR